MLPAVRKKFVNLYWGRSENFHSVATRRFHLGVFKKAASVDGRHLLDDRKSQAIQPMMSPQYRIEEYENHQCGNLSNLLLTFYQ